MIVPYWYGRVFSRFGLFFDGLRAVAFLHKG